MKYIVIIIIIVAVILMIAKNRTPGAAAKGGQTLSGASGMTQSQSIKATIIRKDICAQAKAEPQKPYFESGQNNKQTIYGVLYFELENKKKKHFYVSEKTFQNVSEGYCGSLTYSGNHFIRFEPDNLES